MLGSRFYYKPSLTPHDTCTSYIHGPAILLHHSCTQSASARNDRCSSPSQDMQGILSFVNDENANKRRKALRACQRCKESKVCICLRAHAMIES